MFKEGVTLTVQIAKPNEKPIHVGMVLDRSQPLDEQSLQGLLKHAGRSLHVAMKARRERAAIDAGLLR